MRRPSVPSSLQCGLVAVLFVVLVYLPIVPWNSAHVLDARGFATVGTPAIGGTPGVTRPGPPASPGGTPTALSATPDTTAVATPHVAAPGSSASPAIETVLGTPIRPSATPTSGILSASLLDDFNPLSFTITGRPQVAQSTLVVEVSDTSNITRQPGWHLTLSLDRFQVAGATSRSLPSDAASVVGVTVRCVGAVPCGEPENTITYPLVLRAGKPVTVYNAAPGSGSGQFIITLVVAVQVPGDAHAGGYDTGVVVGIARGR